ncbi:hypothetical protein IMCC9480_1067 [Oxalobacteraceae bacterium IMCC9480]|nr:hypothetical protein IMCC9480_1067 [Oxalobacteraceae bacterium IMCC9480]
MGGDGDAIEMGDQRSGLGIGISTCRHRFGDNPISDVGIQMRGNRRIEAQHMRQHQCIRQAMRHMEMPSERVSQCMHRRHRRIRKSLPRQRRTEQHRFTRNAVVAISAGSDDMRRQQRQRLLRQHVRQRIFQAHAGISLDRMDHRIDAGGGSGSRRQTQRQFGIKDREVGNEQGRDHPALGGGTSRHNRNRGHFGTGAGRGRYLHQRQARTDDVADAVHGVEWLAGSHQHRDQFGHIHRRPAAQPDHQLGAPVTRTLRGSQHDMVRRIGDHVVDDLHRKTGRSKAGQRRCEQAAAMQEAVGDQAQTGRGKALAQQFAKLAGCAEFDDQCGDGGEFKGNAHADILVIVLERGVKREVAGSLCMGQRINSLGRLPFSKHDIRPFDFLPEFVGDARPINNVDPQRQITVDQRFQ